jgi:uncharacterized protein (TIGR02996 family)
MNPDRAALLAGIAANPDNDLRRLVFADWLEEHGEAARAEFIRLQIEGRRITDPDALKPFDARVRELFRDHAADWFAPFLPALDPQRHIPTAYSFIPGGARQCVISVARDTPPVPGYLRSASVGRGHIGNITLALEDLPAGSSIGAALAHEPVPALYAHLSGDHREWKRFSEPALRHVTDLTLEEATNGAPLVAALAAFTDSHLPAVRTFRLRTRSRDAQPRRVPPVHAATVRVFAESPLAYRVTNLSLDLDDAGLRALSRSDWLELDKLIVTGTVGRAGVLALNTARFAAGLRSLEIATQVGDEGVAALAAGTRFAKLVDLDLAGNDITDAGLRVLASARFLPQLEVLDLSENQLQLTDDAPGLRALADALNPDALRKLRLGDAGFVTVPAYLSDRFGDRVTTS